MISYLLCSLPTENSDEPPGIDLCNMTHSVFNAYSLIQIKCAMFCFCVNIARPMRDLDTLCFPLYMT